MDQLWSPWRSEFISGSDERDAQDEKVSPFARAWAEPERDDDNYLLHRGTEAFVILNRYPYNAGHLLVVPVRQIGDFLELTSSERAEMMELIAFGIEILKLALKPHGFNVGMNLSRTAGAGIEYHVHFHIVPRWNGDTNFMPVFDETRVISESMRQVFDKLKNARLTLLNT